jgi:hypothetical protein
VSVTAATDHVSVSAPVENVFSSLLTEDINPLNVSIESMYPASKRRRSQIPIARKNATGTSSKGGTGSSKSTKAAAVEKVINTLPVDVEPSENIEPNNNNVMVWEDPIVDEENEPLKNVPTKLSSMEAGNQSKVAVIAPPTRSRRQSLAQVSMMLQALSDPMAAEDGGITTRARRVSVSTLTSQSPAVINAAATTSRRKSSVSRRLM